jgi:mono/diheme cytochrome c family protein
MVGASTLRYVSRGLIVAAILATTPAFGADADNGQRLAHRWCEACHVVVVSPTQRRTTTDQAPPFASIAMTPGFDAAKIALFLLDPHPKMPDMGLSRKEADDLAAYIATLK